MRLIMLGPRDGLLVSRVLAMLQPTSVRLSLETYFLDSEKYPAQIIAFLFLFKALSQNQPPIVPAPLFPSFQPSAVSELQHGENFA